MRKCRKKADLGGVFGTIVPALNGIGNILDETTAKQPINQNPGDITTIMKYGGRVRPKCWIGAAIGAATGIASSIIGNSAKRKAERDAAALKNRQTMISDLQARDKNLNNMYSYVNDDSQVEPNLIYRKGGNVSSYQPRGVRQLARRGNVGMRITDGGVAQRIGNNTFLLRGSLHSQVNPTGNTGIGIKVGKNQVEAEGGEVAQKVGNSLRIFSNVPMLNGVSPARAVTMGANKNRVFNLQEYLKRNLK